MKPCASLVGQQIDLFGLVPAPASRSRSQGKGRGQRTSATCGLPSSGSSPSVSLQRRLENKLQARLPSDGSMEYSLTWKVRVTPAGRRICALRASARRTSASDSSGELSDWPTPTVGNAEGWQTHKGANAQGRRPDGSKMTVSLGHVAKMAGWSTPAARDHHPCGKHTNGTHDQVNLPQQAQFAGPTTGLLGCQALEAIGPPSTSSPAGTENRGALNPAHSRWLQGYPEAWCRAAILAYRSIPKRRRKPA